MRCRVGDLAVMVYSERGQEGKIVEIVRFLGIVEFDDGRTQKDCWLVKGNVIGDLWSRLQGGDGVISDAWLRPLRDPGDDARDEMLRPLPQEVTA